jgi:hypothetical protein
LIVKDTALKAVDAVEAGAQNMAKFVPAGTGALLSAVPVVWPKRSSAAVPAVGTEKVA